MMKSLLTNALILSALFSAGSLLTSPSEARACGGYGRIESSIAESSPVQALLRSHFQEIYGELEDVDFIRTYDPNVVGVHVRVRRDDELVRETWMVRVRFEHDGSPQIVHARRG